MLCNLIFQYTLTSEHSIHDMFKYHCVTTFVHEIVAKHTKFVLLQRFATWLTSSNIPTGQVNSGLKHRVLEVPHFVWDRVFSGSVAINQCHRAQGTLATTLLWHGPGGSIGRWNLGGWLIANRLWSWSWLVWLNSSLFNFQDFKANMFTVRRPARTSGGGFRNRRRWKGCFALFAGTWKRM